MASMAPPHGLLNPKYLLSKKVKERSQALVEHLLTSDYDVVGLQEVFLEWHAKYFIDGVQVSTGVLAPAGSKLDRSSWGSQVQTLMGHILKLLHTLFLIRRCLVTLTGLEVVHWGALAC